MSYSKYTSTENLKITYLLGAGASYNSNPIWKAQGQSMIDVANQVLYKISPDPYGEIKRIESLIGNEKLINFFSKLKQFGQFAIEYGSIDIYAKRLFLIKSEKELNDLKHCLSVYFDIWENFAYDYFNLYLGDDIFGKNSIKYEKIDKRFFALLSVILEEGNNEVPKLNDKISFLTWNYDLQLENAFETFLPIKTLSLNDTNKYLKFLMLNQQQNDVIHLNGFRGYFVDEGKIYETVERDRLDSLEEYLTRLSQNFKDFSNTDYSNSIKYAWELGSETEINAKKMMSETNILVIIGYSFPAFNRKIDTDLIKEFEKGSGYKKVYYQDPNGNKDLVNLLFSRPEEIEYITNSSQFHIPHEFLSPSPGADIFV